MRAQRSEAGGRMVDIAGKEVTDRRAVARARVRMSAEAFAAVRDGELPKGDAIGTARVAGILAAKRTPELVPLCHPIPVSHVGIEITLELARREVVIEGTVRARAATGVEMEALTAVAVAALVIYDMCKGIDPAAEISQIRVVRKEGGKSGEWQRKAR
jgi:cyclic pyranopterin phosphate synthase